MRVREAMSAPVIAASPWTPIRDALLLMRAQGVGALPVAAGGRLLGIVTAGDVIKGFLPGARAETPVRRIMTRDPVVCHAADGLAQVGALMAARGVRRLPVLDAQGRLVGMLAARDIAGDASRALPRAAEAQAPARGAVVGPPS